MMPDEVESLTPAEYQAMIAGGEQRTVNAIYDTMAVNQSSINPVVLITEPSKFQTPQFDQSMQQRKDLIKSLMDEQFRKEQEHKKSQQDLFGQMFITSNHGRKEGNE